MRRGDSRVWQRWFAASVALFALVVLVALAGDSEVNSGSDAGGKTATVAALVDNGLDGVDLGYWAETLDADGRLHPIIKTYPGNEGWVQVTSAVMPFASSPGRSLAGSLGSLWLSIVAVPIGALAAAHLSRTLGASSGVMAFVVVGALSPLAFYGADQWEHAPALAAGLWGVALLRRRVSGPLVVAMAIVAALAIVLRRESAFVLLALGLVEMLSGEARRHWLKQRVWVALGGIGGVALLAATQLFDRAVLGSSTSDRSFSQARGVGSDLGQRLEDSFLTTISLFPTAGFGSVVISALPLLGLGLVAWCTVKNDDRYLRIGIGLAVAGVALRVVLNGLDFVPGALAVLPIAAVAPVMARRSSRPVLWAVLAATVGTLAFQWTGSLGAQWGGRYLLLPAAVLAIVAASELESVGWRAPVSVTAVALTAAMAILGLVWHVERTADVGHSRDQIFEVADGDVVISTHSHFPREIAVAIAGQRWMLADQLEEVDLAFAIAESLAPGESIWLLHPGSCPGPFECRHWADRSGTAAPQGWTPERVVDIDWLGGGTYVLERFVPQPSLAGATEE